MCEATIELKGVIEKIGPLYFNEKTGFTKKTIHFKPKNGKVFYPEFHYNRIRLLNGLKEGDEVTLSFKIWGSEINTINNVVADGIDKSSSSGV